MNAYSLRSICRPHIRGKYIITSDNIFEVLISGVCHPHIISPIWWYIYYIRPHADIIRMREIWCYYIRLFNYKILPFSCIPRLILVKSGRRSLIVREKKRENLGQKYDLIRLASRDYHRSLSGKSITKREVFKNACISLLPV